MDIFWRVQVARFNVNLFQIFSDRHMLGMIFNQMPQPSEVSFGMILIEIIPVAIQVLRSWNMFLEPGSSIVDDFQNYSYGYFQNYFYGYEGVVVSKQLAIL